jgi:hypothetical protein
VADASKRGSKGATALIARRPLRLAIARRRSLIVLWYNIKTKQNEMIIKNIKLRLLSARRFSGVGKDGKPYDFYGCTFLDEESKVIKLNLSGALSKDTGLTSKLDVIKESPAIVDISLHQTGFRLNGTIVKLDTRV